MKKFLSLAACLTVIASLAIGGTVAYLTDTDSAVNIMTLGNVDIEQIEKERIEQSNNNVAETNIQDFTQSKPLMPAVGYPENGWADEYQKFPTGGSSMLFSDQIKNVNDKFVFVENTGNSDAYVRTIFAFEKGTESAQIDFSLIHLNINDYTHQDGGFWKWEDLADTIEVNGVVYEVIVATYMGYSKNGQPADGAHKGGILPAGETTRPSLLQVFLDGKADNEDIAALGSTYDILALSQAVQAAGFDDPETALAAGFGDVTAETAAKWFGGVIATPPTTAGDKTLTDNVSTVDEPLYMNTEATEPYTVNGNGKTVTFVVTDADKFTWSNNGLIPDMSNIFSSANGSKVTVNDLTFKGTISSVMAGHYVQGNQTAQSNFNTVMNNVNIVGTEVVSFSSNISPALTVYGNAELNNCNVYGTTLTALDTDPMWPVKDVALVNYSNTTVNGGKYGTLYLWAHAKLTLNNAEVDKIETVSVNACKGYIVVGEGTTVNSIVLSNTKQNLTIKAGATVNTLDMTGCDESRIIIEDGATVKNIIK